MLPRSKFTLNKSSMRKSTRFFREIGGACSGSGAFEVMKFV